MTDRDRRGPALDAGNDASGYVKNALEAGAVDAGDGVVNDGGFVGILPARAMREAGFLAVVANVGCEISNVVSIEEFPTDDGPSFNLTYIGTRFCIWFDGSLLYSMDEFTVQIVEVSFAGEFKMTLLLARDQETVEQMMRCHRNGGGALIIYERLVPTSSL